mmetsp:Transcript_58954/g.132672  ORF Transcript_58954/g.132672 Transcript_58954/m.132672 type:complete len:284 (-) Transcript_58954:175-1026(-)
MDLNEAHTAQVARFATFCKGKRDAALAGMEVQKNDFITDRLSDDGAIFNCADARVLLETYHQQVLACLRDELDKSVNLSSVFVGQLLSQAQMNGATLQVQDISIIEDSSRIAQVAALPAVNAPPLVHKRGTLSALDASGGPTIDGSALQELQDVKEENRMMKDRNMQLQTEMSTVLRERSMLSSELEQARASVQTGGGVDATVAEYARMLTETKAALDQKSYELETTTREFNQQLSQTPQFIELKSIVRKKNEENKTLKQRMLAAGLAPPDDGQGVELQADDD